MNHTPTPFQEKLNALPGVRCSCGEVISLGDWDEIPDAHGKVFRRKLRTMGQVWGAYRRHWLKNLEPS